jgi:hypothetical protein
MAAGVGRAEAMGGPVTGAVVPVHSVLRRRSTIVGTGAQVGGAEPLGRVVEDAGRTEAPSKVLRTSDRLAVRTATSPPRSSRRRPRRSASAIGPGPRGGG